LIVDGSSLGGHLKTGHTWTLQNRPTKRNQNKSIYTLGLGVSANTFLEKRSLQAYTGLTWAEDTAPQGCDRSADSAAGMAGASPDALILGGELEVQSIENG
jgi:hypothetical protein